MQKWKIKLFCVKIRFITFNKLFSENTIMTPQAAFVGADAEEFILSKPSSTHETCIFTHVLLINSTAIIKLVCLKLTQAHQAQAKRW